MVAANAPLPRLGLGMAALGRPGYINLNRSVLLGDNQTRTVERMQEQANQVMDRLFLLTKEEEEGNGLVQLPWLDCARSYGLSEQFVSDYLHKNHIAPNKVYVSSKWGYTYVANFQVSLPVGQPHEIKDHSTENFLKQVQETSRLLGEYLNLYQIHSATMDSGILLNTTAHETMASYREQYGWKIGLSVSSPQQDQIIQTALKLRVLGGDQKDIPLFDSVQCTYNVLEQQAGNALEEAHEAGLDIIIKEGLANGRVLQHPTIVEYSSKLNCQPDQLALGCILAQSFQPCVLSGAITPEQLESNWEAMKISQILSNNKELLDEIMTSCRMDSNQYWSDRAKLVWN